MVPTSWSELAVVMDCEDKRKMICEGRMDDGGGLATLTDCKSRSIFRKQVRTSPAFRFALKSQHNTLANTGICLQVNFTGHWSSSKHQLDSFIIETTNWKVICSSSSSENNVNKKLKRNCLLTWMNSFHDTCHVTISFFAFFECMNIVEDTWSKDNRVWRWGQADYFGVGFGIVFCGFLWFYYSKLWFQYCFLLLCMVLV